MWPPASHFHPLTLAHVTNGMERSFLRGPDIASESFSAQLWAAPANYLELASKMTSIFLDHLRDPLNSVFRLHIKYFGVSILPESKSLFKETVNRG